MVEVEKQTEVAGDRRRGPDGIGAVAAGRRAPNLDKVPDRRRTTIFSGVGDEHSHVTEHIPLSQLGPPEDVVGLEAGRLVRARAAAPPPFAALAPDDPPFGRMEWGLMQSRWTGGRPAGPHACQSVRDLDTGRSSTTSSRWTGVSGIPGVIS